MRAQPDEKVVQWLDEQPDESIWITTITIFEIRFGIEILPSSRRRNELESLFEKTVKDGFKQRLLPVDEAAASCAADLAAKGRALGKPVDIQDALIAGIVRTHRATLATRNVKHFEDFAVKVVNPWKTA